MQVSSKVNFEELARSTDEMNGAQLKAVCVEAGMIALREGSKMIGHEHYLSGVLEVQSKKKNDQVRHLSTHLDANAQSTNNAYPYSSTLLDLRRRVFAFFCEIQFAVFP